jgi:hypothetical protein
MIPRRILYVHVHLHMTFREKIEDLTENIVHKRQTLKHDASAVIHARESTQARLCEHFQIRLCAEK